MDNQREKLIELLKKADPDCYATRSCDGCFYIKQGACDIHYIADQILADEEIKHAFELLKAEKEGRLIVPPCKVGDTVYVISQGQGFNCRWGVYEGKVTDIHIDKYNKITIRAENGEKFFGYYEPKFVFLSREDAENALKGVE